MTKTSIRRHSLTALFWIIEKKIKQFFFEPKSGSVQGGCFLHSFKKLEINTLTSKNDGTSPGKLQKN